MIGHDQIRLVLEKDRPAGSLLFVGPASVGKWTLAEHLVRVWGIPEDDVFWFHRLDLDTARALALCLQHYPVAGDCRVIVVRYDQTSELAFNALLKTMEESSDVNHFILVGSTLPPETIMSRCTLFVFSLLQVAEVEKVLAERRFNSIDARKLAASSGGQVRKALNSIEDHEQHLAVLHAMHAIIQRDEAALDGLAAKWTAQHTTLMDTLCHEIMTQRWKVFAASDVEGVSRRTALKVLVALTPEVRPRLVVRAGLMGVLRSEP